MARKTATKSVKIVRVPSAPRAGAIAPRRSNATAIRRKYAEKLANASRRRTALAREQSHRLTAAAAAGALALAESYAPDVMDSLSIGPLRPAATLGLGLFAAEAMGLIKGKTIEHATTGILAVGVYETIREMAGTAGSPTWG